MKSKNWICLLTGCAAAAALLPLPLQLISADSAKSDDIVILYTNDIHCAADANIGYAGLALYQREMQAQYSHVFTVDAGDSIQGGPIGTISKGKDIITLMNAVGYDVCIPGNHEFVYSTEVLKERGKELKCGYTCCNIRNPETDQTMFEPYRILEAGDRKIAFVGVTTPETLSGTAPVYFQDDDGKVTYTFGEKDGELVRFVQDSIDAARKANPDYVILVAHLGEKDSVREWSTPVVVSQLKGIDAVIDAHSHEEIPAEEAKDADGKPVVITQTGTRLNHIGKMTISSDGKIRTELVSSVPEPDKKLDLPADSWKKLEDTGKYVDAKVQDAMDEINERLDESLEKKIGETPFRLYDSDPETGKRRVRNGETNLGDLCADAYRISMGADIGMINGGGIRSFIEPGDISYREAMSVMPFGNMTCVARVKGQQILDLLEVNSRKYPEESGSFLHVSGMTYAIDPDVESTVVLDDDGNFVEITGARRVHSVMVGGEPLDPEKEYTVSCHDYYLKNGGEGYIVSGKCEILRNGVITDSEMIADFIRDHLDGVIPEEYRDPAGQGRIRFEKSPAAEPASEPAEPATVPTNPTEPTVTEPAANPTEPATEPTEPPAEPGLPGLPIPPEMLAMLQQAGISEAELIGLDWSKLPDHPTQEDLQKFLMEQMNPGEPEIGENGLPEGIDPSIFPEGFDYTKIDWSKLPPGIDLSNLPEDFDWNLLLADDAQGDVQETQPQQPIYVVPFSLTPRKPYTPTPVKEIAHKTYDYITSSPDPAPRRTEPTRDTPYTGERTAAGAVGAAAVLALFAAAFVRRKP